MSAITFATRWHIQQQRHNSKAKATQSAALEDAAARLVEQVLRRAIQSLCHSSLEDGPAPCAASMTAPSLPHGMSARMTAPTTQTPEEDDEQEQAYQEFTPPSAAWQPPVPARLDTSASLGRPGQESLNTWYVKAAKDLGVSVAALKAVAHVESNGQGKLKSGKPPILFEAHIFARYTGGRYNQSHPHLSSARWDKSLYGKGGEHQWQRLEEARRLDPKAALMATSFGRFQIMGFNYRAAGYPTVEAFAAAMGKGEVEQFKALCNFLKSNPAMLNALRREDWTAFARAYNGVDFAKNNYHIRLAKAAQSFQA